MNELQIAYIRRFIDLERKDTEKDIEDHRRCLDHLEHFLATQLPPAESSDEVLVKWAEDCGFFEHGKDDYPDCPI